MWWYSSCEAIDGYVYNVPLIFGSLSPPKVDPGRVDGGSLFYRSNLEIYRQQFWFSVDIRFEHYNLLTELLAYLLTYLLIPR